MKTLQAIPCLGRKEQRRYEADAIVTMAADLQLLTRQDVVFPLVAPRLVQDDFT